jgi:hypothetical protein
LKPILNGLLEILKERKEEISTAFGKKIIPFGIEKLKVLEFFQLCLRIPENYGIRRFLQEQKMFKILLVNRNINKKE